MRLGIELKFHEKQLGTAVWTGLFGGIFAALFLDYSLILKPIDAPIFF